MLLPQRPPRLGDLATRSPQHVRIHARQQSQKTVAASIQRLRLSKKGSVAVYNDETAPQAASEDDSPTSVAARHALSSNYRRYQSCPRHVLAVHRSKRSVNPVFVPGSAVSASFMAIAKVDPPDTPVKIPSFAASFFAQAIPSGPGTGIRSS